jgi:hypothetical protein
MDFKDLVEKVKPDVTVKMIEKYKPYLTKIGIKPNDILDLMSKVPVIRFLAYADKAFNSMSEEQKIEFIKNCMIAAAKAAA